MIDDDAPRCHGGRCHTDSGTGAFESCEFHRKEDEMGEQEGAGAEGLAPVAAINGPTKKNAERAKMLLAAYLDGKVDGIVILTATENATFDAQFADFQGETHTSRTLYCQTMLIAQHLLARIGG